MYTAFSSTVPRSHHRVNLVRNYHDSAGSLNSPTRHLTCTHSHAPAGSVINGVYCSSSLLSNNQYVIPVGVSVADQVLTGSDRSNLVSIPWHAPGTNCLRMGHSHSSGKHCFDATWTNRHSGADQVLTASDHSNLVIDRQATNTNCLCMGHSHSFGKHSLDATCRNQHLVLESVGSRSCFQHQPEQMLISYDQNLGVTRPLRSKQHQHPHQHQQKELPHQLQQLYQQQCQQMMPHDPQLICHPARQQQENKHYTPQEQQWESDMQSHLPGQSIDSNSVQEQCVGFDCIALEGESCCWKINILAFFKYIRSIKQLYWLVLIIYFIIMPFAPLSYTIIIHCSYKQACRNQ